jgi:hypothetical protein
LSLSCPFFIFGVICCICDTKAAHNFHLLKVGFINTRVLLFSFIDYIMMKNIDYRKYCQYSSYKQSVGWVFSQCTQYILSIIGFSCYHI